MHPLQTHFSFASVNTTNKEAKNVVENIIRKYNVQGGELKGSRLIKYHKGRKAISEILKIFRGRFKVTLSDKKYALAGKFFEYIFEPCISENSALFYSLNFHKFISNVLYMLFISRAAGAEELFDEFEKAMRSKDFEHIKLMLSTGKNELDPVLEHIGDFIEANEISIINELNGLTDIEVGKWMLDLSNTALFTLLADWGQEYDQLTVFCDNSKPIQATLEMYEVMIGREERKYAEVGNKKFPLTFNLSGPIQLVDSKEYFGVQIADAIAAAIIHAVSGGDEKHAIEWRKILLECTLHGNILPDLQCADLNRLDVQRNALILLELRDRSMRGVSLIEDMYDYVQFISQRLLIDPIDINV